MVEARLREVLVVFLQLSLVGLLGIGVVLAMRGKVMMIDMQLFHEHPITSLIILFSDSSIMLPAIVYLFIVVILKDRASLLLRKDASLDVLLEEVFEGEKLEKVRVMLRELKGQGDVLGRALLSVIIEYMGIVIFVPLSMFGIQSAFYMLFWKPIREVIDAVNHMTGTERMVAEIAIGPLYLLGGLPFVLSVFLPMYLVRDVFFRDVRVSGFSTRDLVRIPMYTAFIFVSLWLVGPLAVVLYGPALETPGYPSQCYRLFLAVLLWAVPLALDWLAFGITPANAALAMQVPAVLGALCAAIILWTHLSIPASTSLLLLILLFLAANSILTYWMVKTMFQALGDKESIFISREIMRLGEVLLS